MRGLRFGVWGRQSRWAVILRCVETNDGVGHGETHLTVTSVRGRPIHRPEYEGLANYQVHASSFVPKQSANTK